MHIAVVPKLGLSYPSGVIAILLGVMQSQNHHVVPYYGKSLRITEGK